MRILDGGWHWIIESMKSWTLVQDVIRWNINATNVAQELDRQGIKKARLCGVCRAYSGSNIRSTNISHKHQLFGSKFGWRYYEKNMGFSKHSSDRLILNSAWFLDCNILWRRLEAWPFSRHDALVTWRPEAWHANEVLQEGPLIKDLGRCGHIPENNRGNDTKVPRQVDKFSELVKDVLGTIFQVLSFVSFTNSLTKDDNHDFFQATIHLAYISHSQPRQSQRLCISCSWSTWGSSQKMEPWPSLSGDENPAGVCLKMKNPTIPKTFSRGDRRGNLKCKWFRVILICIYRYML